jgi:hypothetical protein
VPASAKVPPAVASEEIATQSATARDYLGEIDEMEIDRPAIPPEDRLSAHTVDSLHAP